jgi:hypothetical protein
MRARPHSKSKKRADEMLSADELERALALLSDEATAVHTDPRELIRELVDNLLVGTIIFGGPIGLLVVWFDFWWGVGLLLSAVLAFVLLALTPARLADANSFRASLEDTELFQAANEVWTNRLRLSNVVVLGAPLAVLGGLVWLFYELFATGEVRLLPLLVIAAPSLIFWVWLAFDNVRELRYFSRVSSLRGQFEDRLEAVRHEPSEVPISGDELNFLAKAETHQTQRAVEAVVEEQVPKVLEHSYSVSVDAAAQQDLEQLAGENFSEWLRIQQTILSLQFEPRPPSAKPAAEVPDALEVLAGQRGVDYIVDDDMHRVYVVGIDEGQETDTRHAS